MPVVFLFLLAACSDIQVTTADNYEVVELPDGSVVYLNHNSTVAYDSDFESRTIEISGEVFLDVVPADAPFVVKTPHGEIRVLGTEFNARSDEEELDVEVTEGVVELKTETDNKKIKRGERGTWRKSGSGIKKGKAELNFKVWLKALKKEFKQLGREIKRGGKEVGWESEKAAKDLTKGLKKLKNEL